MKKRDKFMIGSHFSSFSYGYKSNWVNKKYKFLTTILLGALLMSACSNSDTESSKALESTAQESTQVSVQEGTTQESVQKGVTENSSIAVINEDGSTVTDQGAISIFEDFNTLEEAAKLAGFELAAPEKIEGYEHRYIQAAKNEVIQVIYDDSAAENSITIRKSNNVKDNTISCDPNQYSNHKELDVDGVKVTTWSNEEGSVSLATWANGNYSYSFALNKAMPEDKLIDIVKGIK